MTKKKCANTTFSFFIFMTSKVTFPIFSLRRIESPYDSFDESKELSGVKSYVAVVNVSDIPFELDQWRDVNPREAKLNTEVAKAIATTLTQEPELFFLRNRGITILAQEVSLDQANNKLTITLSDPTIHGILDGGHTFKVIMSELEQLSESIRKESNAYVRIEIIQGITSENKDDADSIVEARNKSREVRSADMENLQGRFKAIKNILSNQKYAELIAYKSGETDESDERKPIDIQDILSYMICFDIEEYPNGEKNPIRAYSSKTSVVRHFGSVEGRIDALAPILPDILKLHDRIYFEIPEIWNRNQGKFASITGVSERQKPKKLHFIDRQTKLEIPYAFIYPLLSSLRVLVTKDEANMTYKWRSDPFKFWEKNNDSLVGAIKGYATAIRNPTKMGKDNNVWKQCFSTAESNYLRNMLQSSL